MMPRQHVGGLASWRGTGAQMRAVGPGTGAISGYVHKAATTANYFARLISGRFFGMMNDAKINANPPRPAR